MVVQFKKSPTAYFLKRKRKEKKKKIRNKTNKNKKFNVYQTLRAVNFLDDGIYKRLKCNRTRLSIESLKVYCNKKNNTVNKINK